MKVLSEAQLEELSRDAGIIRIRPTSARVAESESDIVAVIAEARRSGTKLTPRGGGTAIPSQSVGRGIILLQDRKRVRRAGEWAVSCEPAVVKSELNLGLEGSGRWMPVDPSSYGSCTIGGMVANNSSGIRTPRYGSTIDYVQEVRVAFAEGGASTLGPLTVESALSSEGRTRRVASLLLENQKAISEDRPRVSKNSSGYRLERVLHDGLIDLPKLFTGSEGTLGVLAEATLALVPRPDWRSLFVVETDLKQLDEVVSAFREHLPSAIELVDKSVFRKMGKMDRVSRFSRTEDEYLIFCELEGDQRDEAARLQAVAESKAGGYDPMVLTDGTEISRAWEVRNETLALAQDFRNGEKSLVPGVEDLVVPKERLGDLAKLLVDQFHERGLEYISYGHAGDANLHARPLLDYGSDAGKRMLKDLMEDCFEEVWKMGGSMTGEHGDGMLRAPYVEMQYPKSYWIMKEIKEIYDPKHILNPGVKVA